MRLVFCHGPPFSNPRSRASIPCNIHEICLLSRPAICSFCTQNLDQVQYSWEDSWLKRIGFFPTNCRGPPQADKICQDSYKIDSLIFSRNVHFLRCHPTLANFFSVTKKSASSLSTKLGCCVIAFRCGSIHNVCQFCRALVQSFNFSWQKLTQSVKSCRVKKARFMTNFKSFDKFS